MAKKTISRRKFMTLTGSAITGAYLALNSGLAQAMMGSGGMGGGMGGTSIIDPPPGLPFKVPETARMTNGVYELEVAETDIDINGTAARLLTYNGMFPGPTIRARKNEMLRVKLTNHLPYTQEKNILGHTKNITNLHTHGLHVTPNMPGDSMMVQLNPEDHFDYEYCMDHEEPGHLNFYHPHVHGVAAEQYWSGLVGALVVEDDVPIYPENTHVMVLKDITLSGSAPEPYTSTMQYMHGKEGTLVMVNGQVNPVLDIQPGQVQRWQIVNACNARFFKLSLENHTMQLIGTDSGLLDKPYPVSSILLSPGERIDVLVKASLTKKNYRLLSLPYNRGGMSPQQQVTLLTLACKGSRINDTMPTSINPDAKRIVMDTAALPQRQLTLSMMQGRGYINGQTFLGMESACTIVSNVDTWEVWEIINQSGMDHPFHQHVNSAQVLSITGGDSTYAALYTKTPAWKDVVIVPKWGRVKLLVPVTDYGGMTMFHCHIIEHEDIGMMGVWDIRGGGMPM